jgi:hypothetical protein
MKYSFPSCTSLGATGLIQLDIGGQFLVSDALALHIAGVKYKGIYNPLNYLKDCLRFKKFLFPAGGPTFSGASPRLRLIRLESDSPSRRCRRRFFSSSTVSVTITRGLDVGI